MEFAPLIKGLIIALLIVTIGLLGRIRRIGFWGAILLSIILTPIGGFLITMLSGPRPIGVKPKKATLAHPEPKKTHWYSRAT